ncbi:nuclease-related domain-containing protein [Fervidobacterium thailandense]|uniref:NERD domain-containing protein n=1 Tax=Fervidobacterium thailandense TaxID=1008305 RepID=A0A1E3G250_9BACT|nr:nuclease-related domain-containing protein [Fervidobacterium thailandense]ODN30336.1 hypothetical protein A4H02_05655 [Fervidobacterium thailandense]
MIGQEFLKTLFLNLLMICVVIPLLVYCTYAFMLYFSFRKSSYSDFNKRFIKVLFDKGARGEFKIFRLLEKLVDKYSKGMAFIVPNVYVQKGNSETSEVDIVLVAPSGIVVVESKNYAGSVYGKIDEKFWTQVLPGKKSRFLNPLIQNEGHVKALSEFLKLPKESFRSVVVFPDSCNLKVERPVSNKVVLVKFSELPKVVKQFLSEPKIFTLGEVFQFNKVLVERSLVDEEIKRTHIEKVKEKRASWQRSLD